MIGSFAGESRSVGVVVVYELDHHEKEALTLVGADFDKANVGSCVLGAEHYEHEKAGDVGAEHEVSVGGGCVVLHAAEVSRKRRLETVVGIAECVAGRDTKATSGGACDITYDAMRLAAAELVHGLQANGVAH